MQRFRPILFSLALLVLVAPAPAQDLVHEQPMVPGGGVLRVSSFWIDPTGQNDLDVDAQAWEDFEFPRDVSIERVRWWGEAAPDLGFQIEFYHQDPNTAAVQPDLVAGPFAVSTHPLVTGVSVEPGLFVFEVVLPTPVSVAANERTFVSVIGLTSTPLSTWQWAEGTGGTNGTFWYWSVQHTYLAVADERAVSLATDLGWPVGTPYCAGDGSGVSCPCANPGGTGEGCRNASGAGGRLDAYGEALVGANSLTLVATRCPAGVPGLFFGGPNALAGLPFGDGLRCVGGGVTRLGVVFTDASGYAQSQTNLALAEGLSGGELRRYQYWFRDLAGPCGGGFNTTEGLAVQW